MGAGEVMSQVQRVVVTGGAKGIGLGCTLKFLADGAEVYCVDNDEIALQELATAHPSSKLHVSKVDVSSEKAIESFASTVAKDSSKIDALVNCAGIQTYGTVTETTEELWDKTFAVNTKAMFFTAKHFVPLLKNNGGGAIVNISSVQSNVAQKGVVAYASSKGAINTLTRALAIDLAEFQIRANAVLPGSVDTPMLRGAAELFKGDKEVEEVLADWGKSHPLGRVAKPSEIGDLVAFLCSDSALFITGGLFTIDGGLTAQVPVVLPK
jgi:NAD(P)-dependent dehydrogenase (short-subunit alcohol dehydrogenase family)